MGSSDSDEEMLEWELIEDIINDDHPFLPSFLPNTSSAVVEKKVGKRKRKSKVNEASSSANVEQTTMLELQKSRVRIMADLIRIRNDEIKLKERALRLKKHELMMKEMDLKVREVKVKEMEFELKLLCKDTSKMPERQLQDYEQLCKSIRKKYGIA